MTEELQKLNEGYLPLDEEGGIRLDMRKVDATLRYAGMRVLVSDVVRNPLECCVAYEEHNQVEHAFNTLKARFTCDKTDVHSTQAWKEKLYLQLLITSINDMIRSRIKLYNVYMTKFPNGWIFDKSVGKKKALFAILNVPEPTTEQVVTWLRKKRAQFRLLRWGS